MSNFGTHLFIGLVVTITLILLFLPSYIFNLEILKLDNLISILIPSFVFSNIPDVDNKNAKISRYLIMFFIISLILFFINSIALWQRIAISIFSGLLVLYYLLFAEDSYDHRKFPHTFTFGLITSIFISIIFGSMIVLLIALVCFSSHILLDNHLFEAIDKDKKLWARLLKR